MRLFLSAAESHLEVGGSPPFESALLNCNKLPATYSLSEVFRKMTTGPSKREMVHGGCVVVPVWTFKARLVGSTLYHCYCSKAEVTRDGLMCGPHL